MIVQSAFDTRMRVEIDPWGQNPLLEDAKQSVPHLIGPATAERPAPTMFASGDLPPFTSSGIDPEVLNRFPYRARHMAATNPDREAVLGMLEQYAGDPEWVFGHQGFQEYYRRMVDWLSEGKDDGIYDSLFGEHDQVRAEEKERQDAIQRARVEHDRRMAELSAGVPAFSRGRR